MIVVTGAAGFIGSCIIKELNDLGIDNIIAVDNIGQSEKWLNLRYKKIFRYFPKTEFFDWLTSSRNASEIELIIHMGACSATTEVDFDYLYKNNYLYTQQLWNWCTEHQKRFIYASSAATYGDAEFGFNDSIKFLDMLKPLNRYAYSKHVFDLWARKQQDTPSQYVGLKFFNVYGPNEYHKARMASMVYHAYKQISETGYVKLFKSHKSNISDGDQSRDFIYVKDVAKIILFMLKNEKVNGIFNVGTGVERTFNDLVQPIFEALGLKRNVQYIDMPADLQSKYQYKTKADISSLREIGYDSQFITIEDGVKDYVNQYLKKDFCIY